MQDGSPITSLCLSEHTAPATLITSHFSQVVRYYPLPQSFDGEKAVTLTYTRQLVRAHSAPILVSASAPDSTLFATGSSDGIVKVWDSAGGYATHLFRGHGGPVSALRFNFPSVAEGEAPRMELITGSTDGRVRIFDLRDASSRVVGGGGAAAKAKYTLDGHVSVVRAIDITADGKCMITGGRDKVVLVWDMEGNIAKGKGKGKNDGPKIVQTIIAGEQVETAGLLPVDEDVLGSQDGRLKCWTGGEKGVVKIWDVQSAKQLGQMKGVEGVDEDEDKDEDEQRGIISILYVYQSVMPTRSSPILILRSDATRSSLVSVHADQNILFHSIATSSCVRQIIGFNDEIVDTTFLTHPSSSGTSDLASHSHLAMATNSNMIRIYSLSTFSASLLSGHKDMVLCLDKSADFGMLASGAKDSIARIWAPVPSSDASEAGQEKWVCVGICEGHAESVGAIAFSRKPDPAGPRFLVTASQDRTIKLWDLSPLADLSATSDTVPIKLKSLATIRAHEKDINSLDVAPNDKFIASGSQDKLVKLFALDYTEGRANEGARGGLKLLGTCKGHRRGVWTVRFSRTDRVVASGAADRSVRLWSLDDFSCLKVCCLSAHVVALIKLKDRTGADQ
jgi:U3 small nucleolar RNA-associated protein 13